jgi:hypothetical protein
MYRSTGETKAPGRADYQAGFAYFATPVKSVNTQRLSPATQAL